MIVHDELALHGGERTAKDPFPPWPQFNDRAIRDAVEPLKSGRVASWSGTEVTALETRFAAWLGAPHAVACSSGTAALHLAFLSLGVGPGDEVIIPSHTFASSALAARHVGARVVFCEAADDQTLDPRSLERAITSRARVIVAVHLYGIVCDMGPIASIARRHGLRIVEDCAQCVGGEVEGRRAGTLGDIGCFSFSQGKHLCAGGEGGMLVTGDVGIAEAVRSLADYGRSHAEPSPSAHVRAGLNYRLTEMQAAVGLSELARLDTWNLPRRRGYARIYDHSLGQLPGVRALPLSTDARRNAYWKYPLQLVREAFTTDMEELRQAITAEGIPDVGASWPQTYEEPVFASPDAPRCPNAEAVRGRTLVLALHPSWEKGHVETAAAAVKKVLRAYRR
jgi:dTDP-4-amino-4,6-dideoxygalactose transaminase